MSLNTFKFVTLDNDRCLLLPTHNLQTLNFRILRMIFAVDVRLRTLIVRLAMDSAAEPETRNPSLILAAKWSDASSEGSDERNDDFADHAHYKSPITPHFNCGELDASGRYEQLQSTSHCPRNLNAVSDFPAEN